MRYFWSTILGIRNERVRAWELVGWSERYTIHAPNLVKGHDRDIGG
jgi:hypothetical protein